MHVWTGFPFTVFICTAACAVHAVDCNLPLPSLCMAPVPVFAILNVGIVIMMVWIMFAILAISFMRDQMGYCQSLDDYYNVDDCQFPMLLKL